VPAQSVPSNRQYFFAYRVTISNESKAVVMLKSRCAGQVFYSFDPAARRASKLPNGRSLAKPVFPRLWRGPRARPPSQPPKPAAAC
jgi:hypothetical protein